MSGCGWIDNVPEANLRDTLRMNVELHEQTRRKLEEAKARIAELEEALRVNGTGHCCEAGPEGAVCALPTGHGGAHEAGPIVWIG